MAGTDISLQCFRKMDIQEGCHGFWRRETHGHGGGIVGWKLAVAIFFVAPFFGLFMGIPVLLFKNSLDSLWTVFIAGNPGVYLLPGLFSRNYQCIYSAPYRGIYWIPFINRM